MIPLLGLPADGLFSLHDPADSLAEQLIVGMKLPHIGTGDLDDSTHIICGPLNADQAAVLSVVGCMTNVALDVITPQAMDGVEFSAEQPLEQELDDALADFRSSLAAELGVPLESVVLVPDEGGAYLDVTELQSALATASTAGCFLDMGEIPFDGPELTNSGCLDPYCAGCDECDPLGGEPELPAFDQRVPDYEPERSSILIDAAVTVTGERQNQYGDPEDSLQKIADYWNAYLGLSFENGCTPDDLLEPKDVAIMMSLLKIARAGSGYKRDNYVDAAGYMALAGEAELNALTTPERTAH